MEPPLLVTNLKLLPLSAAGQNGQGMAEEVRRRCQGHGEDLAELMSFEVSRGAFPPHEGREIPAVTTLDGLDFAKRPSLDQCEVVELFSGTFVERGKEWF